MTRLFRRSYSTMKIPLKMTDVFRFGSSVWLRRFSSDLSLYSLTGNYSINVHVSVCRTFSVYIDMKNWILHSFLQIRGSVKCLKYIYMNVIGFFLRGYLSACYPSDCLWFNLSPTQDGCQHAVLRIVSDFIYLLNRMVVSMLYFGLSLILFISLTGWLSACCSSDCL